MPGPVIMHVKTAAEDKSVAQAKGAITLGINSFTINPLCRINLCTECVYEWSCKSKNREVIRIRMS